METLTYSAKVLQLISQESGFEPRLFNYVSAWHESLFMQLVICLSCSNVSF